MRFNIEKIKKFFSGHSHFVIAVHKNPDGDALSSALLMAVLLKKMGKKYRIVNQDPLPFKYDFFLERYMEYMIPEFLQVPEGTKLSLMLSESFLKGGLIVLDSSNLYRVGHFAEELKQYVSVLNIDHHGDNNKFGSLNFVDGKASAAAELLYELAEQLNMKVPSLFYELVYIGLASDTGLFSQPNTTAKTLRVLSVLLKKKIPIVHLNSLLKQQKLQFLQLKGRVLQRIEFDGLMAWSYISKRDLQKWDLELKDTENITEVLSSVKDAKIIIVFKQVSASKVKLSFRSRDGYEVLPVAKHFGGGGHNCAAGCEIQGTLKKVIADVVGFCRQYYKEGASAG